MLSQQFLHPNHIKPLVKLIARLMKSANQPITEFFMEDLTAIGQIRRSMRCTSDTGITI